MSSSEEIVIEAFMSENGFADPVFKSAMPTLLSSAGMDASKWSALMDEANVAVAYNWLPICCNPCCMCCFFMNCHNKRLETPMKALCEKWNSENTLPNGIKVRYEMTTTKVLVAKIEGGSGATLDVHHRLIFSAAPSNSAAPNVEMSRA